MSENAPRGNSLREMTREEMLEAHAAHQHFGNGLRWQYIEGDSLHIGPIPPESAWEGQKDIALAAARVHEVISGDLASVVKDLRDARKELSELAEECGSLSSEQMSDCLVGLEGCLNNCLYRMAGTLRSGFDSDDMDNIEMSSLYAAVFAEIAEMASKQEGPGEE